MTEAEWLTANEPKALLMFIWDVKSPRKVRLFAVACCCRLWHLLNDQLRQAVTTAEQFADGTEDQDKLTETCNSLKWDNGFELPAEIPLGAFEAVSWAVLADRGLYPSEAASSAWWVLEGLFGREPLPVQEQEEQRRLAWRIEQGVQADMVRELFGNPFHPITFAPAWRTSDVLLLARGIYEERAFDRTPILADALQDAGCDSDDILNHLRDPHATHVRGCWALDMVLGKE